MDTLDTFFKLVQNGFLILIGAIVTWLLFALAKRIPAIVDTFIDHIPKITNSIFKIETILSNAEITENMKLFHLDHAWKKECLGTIKKNTETILEKLEKLDLFLNRGFKR